MAADSVPPADAEAKKAARKAELKAYKQAWYLANRKRIRAAAAERYQEEREERSVATKAKRAARTEEERAADKAYHQAYYQAHMEVVKARTAARRKTHPPGPSRNTPSRKKAREAWEARNPDKARAAKAKWDAENPEKKNANVRNRRARKAGNGGTHTADDIAALLVRQKGRCAECGTPLKKKYDVDHIKPIALGGSNDRRNLQLLCGPCNRAKGAKHPLRFAQEKGRLL